ncbi:MAG TPA: hypothetical protein VI356_22155 [Myxococcales bacterium]
MDPRAAVTPSIRNFAQAIDRQRKALERVPLLDAAREDLEDAAVALDEAEAAALAIEGFEPERFAAAARAVSVPVLLADLLSEEYRIYESRAAGADAVMFPGALPQELLARLVRAASSTHMAGCVACASAEEVARAGAARAPVIAVAPALLHVGVPPRTLVLSLTFHPSARGRADAALDASLRDAAAFRAALEEEG